MQPVAPFSLQTILSDYRQVTATQRDSGTLFEDLMIVYFKNEPKFKSLYQEVLSYAKWAEKHIEEFGLKNLKDPGIDLVATTFDGQHHAIQCKNYEPSHKMAKSDIDSFMSASGKTYFSYRIIVSTVIDWTQNALDMLENQTPPISTINLSELEQSVIDWEKFYQQHEVKFIEKKQLRPHQEQALAGVTAGLAQAGRGKLIMACGTGKTFTSLKIAETMVGKGKKVLFLVPSLALLSQTLNEWTQESSLPLRNFAVCSDSDVGKNKKSTEDLVIATQSDLDFPATTNAKSLAHVVNALHDNDHMTVVYSTYHSIKVLSDAQMSFGLGEFDLIICDEAHRTTGATFDGEDESAFVMIHSNNNVMGKKRLYMTATPRIYGDTAKATESVQLCSMDDETLYGRELFVINFSQAVSEGLLVDYKVIVLAIEEGQINRRLQDLLSDDDNQLKVDDAAKIVGCWKALAKYGLEEDSDHYEPMKRAVAFCQVIEADYKGSKHKVSSKLISQMFADVVKAYQESEIAVLTEKDPDAKISPSLSLTCACEHVDGSMNASEKQAKIDWLKQPLPDNTCHILSNVRCLSEGVDVPALDAVMFLTPRQSQVDVVQSVGRVMRLAPNKQKGYVILPVVIPAGLEPEDALNNNEVYKVVWQVLNALRSHDNRFDAMINKLEFNGKDTSKMEVVAITDKVAQKTKGLAVTGNTKKAKGGQSIGSNGNLSAPQQMAMEFEVGEIERALYAKIVKKIGNRHHWEDWANDVAKIAQTHIDRIQAILENSKNSEEIKAFEIFASEIRDDLNSSVNNSEVIEMLAQHLVTQPVFEALFEEYDFVKENPMSKAMQSILEKLQEHNIHKESKTLQSFYDSVKIRASGIKTAEGKQKVIKELYDKFFRQAFPKLAEKMGIVYTPIEVIDFIIHSVENVLNDEFDVSLGDKGVHILDPFTGTGSFITRLLQSGIITNEQLSYKYGKEIHANEMLLLAYYIACINIEAVYHSLVIDDYSPFQGICLTDTFEMYEKDDLLSELLVNNTNRLKRQKQLDIRVIFGNPPYSAGQDSANDNNANIAYPRLDERIRATYAQHSTATNKNSLYDSYIRAIRWASDRVSEHKDGGVVGFVTNAGFIDGNTGDGLRKCLAEEFSNLYIFHLRGNARTSGEKRRKEKDNVFGQGTRTPIAVSILVKNPKATEHGKIYFHDIGDYLTREDKLDKIAELESIKGISQVNAWQKIVPDEFNDWLNQRDKNFETYIRMGNKKEKNEMAIFKNYSRGLATSRDTWVYNFSLPALKKNVNTSINFYNEEVERYIESGSNVEAGEFVRYDSTKFTWDRANKWDLEKKKMYKFEKDCLFQASYRPFTRTNVYFNRNMNNMVYQLPQIFPTPSHNNLVIDITGIGTPKDFSCLISNTLPDVQVIANGQCFPKDLYEEVDEQTTDVDIAQQLNSSTAQQLNSSTAQQLNSSTAQQLNSSTAQQLNSSTAQQLNSSTIVPPSGIENLAICLTVSGNKGFSVLMTDSLPDLHLIGDSQCFPMFLYEEVEE